MKANVNINIRNKKVELPKEVFEAFERLEINWSRYLTKHEMNLMFLIIVGTHAAGDALTLKKFALNNPTAYINALANGYTVRSDDMEKEVADRIKKWVYTPYRDPDVDKDIMIFARELINYFQKQT